MQGRIARLTGILGCTLLAACASAAPSEFTTHGLMGDRAGPEGRAQMVNANVITREQIGDRGGNLLSVLRDRVSGAQIRRGETCPEVTLRGQRALRGPSNPEVYVDGNRTANTCVLQMLNPGDVERVEVYPAGITRRAGYAPHPYGLILVFTRRQ